MNPRKRSKTPQSARKNVFSLEQKAILTTLLYSDIFAFPLTKEEIWKYLITKKTISEKQFASHLQSLSVRLVHKKGLYALHGKEHFIEDRLANQVEVMKKYALAKKVSAVLCNIPTIQTICISGSLAAKKATADDDIDLFIITRKNRLFVTRFWVLVILTCMGLRRKRLQKYAPNKICANLLIDTTALAWPAISQNVYTAREIAQLAPLFERDKTFESFLKSNTWVTAYLPNAFDKKLNDLIIHKTSFLERAIDFIVFSLPAELLLRKLQKALIFRHRTREMVTNHTLAFHPKDYGAETLHQLKLKMQELGLLTKK